eukprot:6176565-Pleurochrysis_carterae.AAC.2
MGLPFAHGKLISCNRAPRVHAGIQRGAEGMQRGAEGMQRGAEGVHKGAEECLLAQATSLHATSVLPVALTTWLFPCEFLEYEA